MFGKYARPAQLIRATRLHRSNPQAQAELDALNAQAVADPSFTKAAYLKREAEIIANHTSSDSAPREEN